MLRDLMLIVSVYVYVVAVLTFSKFLIDRYEFSPHLTRNMIHLCAGPTMFLLPFFSAWIYPFTIPLGIVLILGLGLVWQGRLRGMMVEEIEYSRLHALGPIYYALSILILVPLTWDLKAVGMAAVMIMAWGDGAASALAPKLKELHKYPFGDKTVEGSLMMFLFGFLGAGVAWTIGVAAGSPPVSITVGLGIALVGAAVGTLVEAVTVGRAKPFDNLTVPFSSALAMWLLVLV